MNEKYFGKLVEIIPGRLHWISDTHPPEGIKQAFYFCVDKDLKYYPFFSDFGPFNIAQVVRFVTEMDKLLNHEKFNNIKIYHYTSTNTAHRANSAFIMGCYMVYLLVAQVEHESRRNMGEILSD